MTDYMRKLFGFTRTASVMDLRGLSKPLSQRTRSEVRADARRYR